jgi:hypothetical protein
LRAREAGGHKKYHACSNWAPEFIKYSIASAILFWARVWK